MIVFDDSNIDKLFVSPYLRIRAEKAAIYFYQTLTGKSFVIPGDDRHIEAFLREFSSGKTMDEAVKSLKEIFGKYDSDELLVALIQMGVLE